MNPEIQSGKQSDGQMISESQKYPMYITGKSQIDDNKLLYCYICNVEQIWKEHKISYQHKSKLHYFLNNFEESSVEYVKCKLCNNQISKSSFKKHAAKTHKLIPWYRPPTEPILYFINFIKPTKEVYNCLLCDKEFNSWYMALRHIELSKHRIRLRNIIKENVDETRLKIRFCREAIDHYIFSNGASRAQCLACNIIFEEYNAVYEHFTDKTHKINLKNNNIHPVLSLDDSMSLLLEDLKISDPKNSTSDNSAGISNSESRASSSSGFESTSRDPKLNDNNSDNEDNESNKSPEKIEVVSPSNELKIYSKKSAIKEEADLADIKFNDNNCDNEDFESNKSPEKIEVVSRSNELKIYSEKLVIKEEADLALSNLKSINNCTELENLILRFFENYIYIGDDYYYCNLCRQSFSSLSSMSEHLDESDHKQQLLEEQKETCTDGYKAPFMPIFIESLISNNIFPHNLTKLECYTCLTILPSYRSAEEHINSQLHRNNHIFLKAPVENIQRLLPESKIDVAIYCKNFIKKGRTDYYCHLCKSTFTSSIAVMTHIDTFEHCKLLSEETSKAFYETQYSLYFFELCIRNSIFRLSHKKLKCFACKGIEIRKNVYENHIKTPEHQTGIVSNNPSNDNQIPHNDNQIPHNDNQISHNDNQISHNDNQIPHEDDQIPQIEIKNSKSSAEKLIIKKDQLIPECDLENRFLKCFDNYIFVSNSNYFCNLCEKEFSSSSSMFVHILDSTHINLLEERRKKYKINEHKFLHIPKLYEVLVRNNVFQLNPLILICISCGCRISGYISAENHMNTKQHKITHKSRLDEIKSPILIASEDECIDTATVLRKTKTKFAKYFKNSIEMRSEDYYCHLCCINVSSSEVMEHIKKPEHIKFVKNKFKDKYKVRKNIFYTELCVRNGIFCHTVPELKCFTCNNLVGKKENIEKHVQSKEHEMNRESRQQNTILPQSETNLVEPITNVKINKALPLQASNCLSNESKIEINQNIVLRISEKIDDTIQLMTVCDLENNYLIFYENFIFICGNTYRCNLCKKNFLSSSILSHINDSHHQNLLEERRQETGISKHKVVYLPNFHELLIRNNIFQSDSLAIKCLSCECSITDYSTAEDHIDSEWHKNNIKFMAAIMGALIPIESKDKNSSGPQILPDTKEDFAKYFGNFIEKRQEDYYCHLCYITLSTWLEASAHMEVPKHRNIAKDQYVDSKIQSNLYYSELCVRHSIFCYSSTEFQCFSCKKNFFSMNDVELHVAIKRHKKKFKVNSIKKTSTETVPVSTQNSLNNNKNIAIYQSTGSTEGKKINNQSISNLKLEDQFLTCFKHFICIFDKFYYCCLCENAFLSSVLMLLHINDPIHIYLLRKRKQGYAEHTVLYTPNFYELLVRNNVFLLNPLTVECLSCECRINGYISVEDHINGYTHKNTHKSILEEINSPTLVSSEDKNADTIIGLPETKEDFDQYFENFIEKRSEDYYCHLCCTKLSSSEVMVHIKIPKHLNFPKDNYKDKKAKKNFFYTELCVRNGIFSYTDPVLKCFICDKLVGEKKMIEEHVESEEHKTKHESIAISSSVTKTFSSELPTTQNQFLELFKNSIFLHEENCFCNYCEIYLPKSDAMTHIESKCHREKVGYGKKKFLKVCIKVLNNFEELVRNNVFPISSSTLNCYSCNLKFGRYQTIIYHLKTYEHKSGLNKLKTTLIAEDKSAAKESTKEQNKHKSVVNELKTTSVAEVIISKKSLKKQQKSKYDSSNILSCNIYKYNDTRNEFFYCCVCDLKIRSRNILHVHLSGHFWQLFTDEDMDNLMASAKLKSEKVLVLKNESVVQPVLNFLDGRRLAEIKEQGKTGDKKPDKDVSLKKKKKRDKKKDDNKEKKDKKGSGRRFRKIKIEDLDVDENNSSNELDIYEMNEEIRNVIQMSLNRICIINKDEIYCMICRKNVEYSSRIVYEHFRSIEHSYFMTQMVQDHMKFESYPRELSDFELAREMMEDKSDRHVSCFVCNPAKPATIPNNIESLKFHINSERHQDRKKKLNENLQEFISNLYSRLERNWFNIQKYWCVICNNKFNLEHKFCQHSKSESHNKKLQNFIRFENLIFDFCPTCGILYYGFKNTFTYHSECQFHKFYRDKNSYFISQLPKLTEELVANAEEKLKDQLTKLESNEGTRKNEEKLLLKDLKITINNYGNAKLYPFGSRITGLASMSSDLDIFIDCYDSYYKGTEFDDVLNVLTKVESLLMKKKEIWTIKKTITTSRIPIIKLTHNITSIDCDLSFTNGLTTENTKLVKLYVDKYPMCKKLILFMRYWIDACNLNGQDEIRSYAISWMVIYYLQTKFILPSVAELMKTEGESRVVSGWQTKVAKDFKLPDIIDYSFKDLLYGFFIMCAGFDYKNNIICPLLGRPVKKIDFLVPKKMTNLPEEMGPYINFMKKNRKQVDGFRSDSAMGVQDPFDLSHNLTKAVKKFVMYRFRTYCAISANKLIDK